jgi:hypothetical protein
VFNVKYTISVSRMVFWIIKQQEGSCFTELTFIDYHSFIHSFHWHVQNAMIPCRSQELPQFFSVMYFFLPPFSTNYSSIFSHFILPSIFWSTSQFVPKFIYNILLGILFSSILCTCPNQRNLFNLIVPVTVGFLTLA